MDKCMRLYLISLNFCYFFIFSKSETHTAVCRLLLSLVDSVIMFLLSWGRYGFDRHYEAHFATHLADVKRQLNITAKNNNSYAVAA